MKTFTSTNPFSANLLTANQLRQPRGIILINNVQVNWFDIEIMTTTFYLADSYHIQIPLNGQDPLLNLNYWSVTQTLNVQIYIGFPPDPNAFSVQDLDLFMVGDADEIDVDPLSATIRISGRDLTSRLIDTKTTQKFSNQTASSIAIQFANEHGLTPQVTNTTTIVGNFYQTQQTLMTNEYTEWDLLTFLAQQEDFVCFVNKNTLIFEPRPTTSSNPYILTYQPPTTQQASPQYNGMQLRLTRSLTLAKDVSVTVKVPYGTKNHNAFFVKATSRHTVSNASRGPVQKYSYVIAGLSQEQALQKAQSILKDITIHEILLDTRLPGDNLLLKDSLIKLQGTNTAYDQLYYPDQVVRTLNAHTGYTMEVSAKNHSVNTEVTL